MTEVEKLRALLAEARAELHSIEALTVHPGMHHGKDAARLLSVLKRIDAALAEPVSDDFRRGAEAMREAAAQALSTRAGQYAERISVMQSVGMEASGSLLDCRDETEAIKELMLHLPIPEDEP